MDNKLQILHLEDNPVDAELFIETLAAASIPCDITVVDTEADFKKALTDNVFDLVVSDSSLPGFSGKSALKFLNKEHPGVPFIFVSGSIPTDTAGDGSPPSVTWLYVPKHRLEQVVPAIQRLCLDPQ